MTITSLIYSYYAMLCLTACFAVTSLIKKWSLPNWTGFIPLLLSAFGFIGSWIVAQHAPVYDKLAVVPNILFIVILLETVFNYKQLSKSPVWLIIFIITLIGLNETPELSEDYYMYDKLYVMLFFQLRITAIALFTFALVGNVKIMFAYNFGSSTSLLHIARNFTLLGTSIFLTAEWFGSYWCLLWWGDAWHWSTGFFLASSMFLLSMISSHLPAKLHNTELKRTLFAIIPLGSIIIFYLFSH